MSDLNEMSGGPIAGRRAFLAGALASAVLALPACTTMGGLSFTEAIRRLLVLSSDRAFTRLASDGGYWDGAVARIGLNQFLGSRGDVLSRILTSSLFKDRLVSAFADIAERGSYRVAPVVAETVRTIGIANAIDLVRGGPTAATGFLRDNMGASLIDLMVPEVGDGLRLAREPLVGEVLKALTGTDVNAVARSFSVEVDNAIWNQIGVEEAAIRADPRSTNDPLLIGVFGVAAG
ncbi:MAG: DUF4197 domain-containing protein [Sphingomonadales bacterium]|nr:DUF4197 domain-containing protein [Sphingomonadales bacterium]MBD3774809.1 DUF4197 domain-containing protein [Paracoccaceae bacterium]